MRRKWGEVMKLLAIGRLRAGVDVRGDVTRHAREEMRALWQLYGNGVVREMYTPGRPAGIYSIVRFTLTPSTAPK
jgi:hypothetical protein